MSRAHCLLLENVHATAHQELAQHGVAVSTLSRGLGEDELMAELRRLPAEAPAMLGLRSKTHVTERVLDAAPHLVAIGAFCIGTDQIDLAAARAHGVAVFNAPFSSTRSVAELVLGELVMLSRQAFARSAAAHQGRWVKSAEGSHEVRGKVLGIVGYGHIGSQLSILAEALGMRVLFYDIANRLPLGNARRATSLIELLGASDFVSLHVPDTELTRGMIANAEIRAMKPGSCLINASRGQVVDIEALRDALVEAHLSGAAIDVFPQEPAGKDDRFLSPLQGLDNVILTPHVGGSTQEAQAAIGVEVATALSSHLRTGRTLGCVNLPQLGERLSDGACRIVNVHRNVPGVLSQINRVIADSNVNIVGQYLSTLEDVGLLFIDIALSGSDPKITHLSRQIDALTVAIRTRIVDG